MSSVQYVSETPVLVRLVAPNAISALTSRALGRVRHRIPWPMGGLSRYSGRVV